MISISVEEIRDVIIVTIDGILTRETLKEAEDVWNEQLIKKPNVLALDLRELTQIDSVSLNHIFKLANAAKEQQVRLCICDISEPIRKIFEVIKLDKIIHFIPWKKFEAEYISGF
jgi:anti-anti-sigma factor